MSTREALREKIAKAIAFAAPDQAAGEFTWGQVDGVLRAIGISPDVLSWCAANPEAAKGLASGEMVAVKREQIKDLCFSAFMAAFNPNKEDGGASDWMNDTAPQVERWISQIAAPTPAPSGEAQARNPDDDYCPSDLRGPGR